MYHGPFPFAREAVPPAPSSRQSWKYFPTPVSVVNSQGPKGGGLPFPRESPGFYTRRPSPVPGVFPWASTGWGGYRGNEIFFYVCDFARFGQPIQCQRIFFSIGVFRHFRCGKGPFLAGRVRSLSCGVRGLSRASTGLCARVCVSFLECPGTPRVKRFQTDRLFSMGGADIGWEKENDFPLFSPQNRRCFAGSQSRFPFSRGKDPRQTIRSELLFA